MKGSGLFTNAAIGAVLVVPALTLQGHTPRSLEASLERTLAALDVLAGIEQRVQGGERDAVRALVGSTEAPLGDARELDTSLVELRQDVAVLERELDGLHGPAGEVQLPATQDGAPRIPDLAPTTGLDDTTRRSLSGAVTGVVSQEPAHEAPPLNAAPGAPKKQHFEQPGYTADALVLARAYYRQGHWREALTLLEGRLRTPAEMYWRARCLEKLGRNTEAIADFERVVAHPDGGWEAQRAQEDLDFLRWRMKFVRAREDAPSKKDPE